MDPVARQRNDPRGPAPPPGADLALWLDLESMRAHDAVAWLHTTRMSGFLRLSYRDHRKAVYFREGEVVFASSNQRIDRLGSCLVRRGVLSLEELHSANREARPHQRFGKTLVDLGYLKAPRLWDGIRYQVEEIVWSVLAYRSGELAFWRGVAAPDNLVRLRFDTRNLLARGAAWRDELEHWIEDASGDAVRIAVARDPAAPSTPLPRLEGVEAHVVDALHGDATFEETCHRTGLDSVTVARTLQLLEAEGRIEIRRLPEDADSTQRFGRRGASPRTRASLRAADACLQRLVATLAAYDGIDAVRERVQEALDEIAARFPGVLSEVRLTRDAELPLSDLEKELADTPEDVQRDAALACDALIDYLEFEVVNHAQISNSAALLAELRPLREQVKR